jgi:hypothetical protein
VTMSETDLLALLRELDDPEWLEWPENYDRGRARSLLDTLVARPEQDFATPCTAEHDTQDSSEYGRVVVPTQTTACGTRIVVCISKFGLLAMICAENPGAFLGIQDAQSEGELDAGDLATVDRALTDLGCVVAPEELIESDYDGSSRLPWHVQRPSWWHRFFGSF